MILYDTRSAKALGVDLREQGAKGDPTMLSTIVAWVTGIGLSIFFGHLLCLTVKAVCQGMRNRRAASRTQGS